MSIERDMHYAVKDTNGKMTYHYARVWDAERFMNLLKAEYFKEDVEQKATNYTKVISIDEKTYLQNTRKNR